MRQNLAQKTYDVFTAEGPRWLLDSHHDVRSAAIERAEELITESKVEGVRVIAESQRTGEEEVILEEMIDLGDKALQIVPVDDAPVCKNIADFYEFPARQTAGRLLRQLLDEKGQTGLEFGFDYGALKMLERNDKLFPSAMQRIGGILAKKTETKPADQNDFLYKAFEQIKENARIAGEDKARGEPLLNGDLAGLLSKAPGDGAKKKIYVLGAFAGALGQRGDWSQKIQLLIELGDKASDELVLTYLDEIAAEVLDSNQAVTELFGGFGDSSAAFHAIVHLTQGRCRVVNNRSCLEQFNDFLAKRPMPKTKQLLLDRVAQAFGGVRPMTREGQAAELDAFKSLIRELTSVAGLGGGPNMAAAAMRRARVVYADPDDPTLEEVLDNILSLMPNRAVRLGYLLDLIASPDGKKNEKEILGVLARLAQQLTSLSSLLPDDMTPGEVQAALDELREKMSAEGLPEQWRKMFSKTLDRLVAKQGKDGGQGSDGDTLVFKMKDEPKAEAEEAEEAEPLQFKMKDEAQPRRKNIQRREAGAGDVLFEEGDLAEEAYLIADGTVEIYRKSGNDEVVLARLGRGEILGEMSLIDNQPRMASARCVGNAKLTVITRDDLAKRLNKLGSDDKVLRRLIDVFVDRLRGQARMHE